MLGYHAYNYNGVYEKRVYDKNWNPLCQASWLKKEVFYLVSDALPRITLQEHIQHNGPLNKSELKLLMTELLKFLISCQAFGLKSVNLSTENIGHTDGEWKVFNVCHTATSKLDPKYIAPEFWTEQANFTANHSKQMSYQVGVLMLECCGLETGLYVKEPNSSDPIYKYLYQDHLDKSTFFSKLDGKNYKLHKELKALILSLI